MRFLIVFFILTASLPIFAQEDSLTGVWQTEGYGFVFDIQPEQVTVYQATAVTCTTFLVSDEILTYENDTVQAVAPVGEVVGAVSGISELPLEFQREGERLTYSIGAGISPIYAGRVDSLPAPCTDDRLNASDPEATFETFWNLYNEHYAFFDLHGVDWQALYEEYRPQVTAETSDQDLFKLMQEMIAPIEDNHIFLIAAMPMFYVGGSTPEWANGGDEATLQAYLGVVVENYLNGEYQETGNGLIQYGRLADTIGYIHILSMAGYADSEAQELEVLAAGMDEAMNALSDVEVMVVDIRFNGGGYDTNSLYIAGRFAEGQSLAFTKQARMGEGLTPAFEAYVEPTGDTQFTGDVYLLTSGMSVSAAETFTLAMSALPNVTIVGEPTAGAFSDIYFVLLPNGWLMGFSNEVYTSHNGKVYEGVGIPPEIEAPMSAEALDEGRDPAIDAVLERLSE